MESIGARCSICLKRRELTEDHIFPKSLVVPGTRQIRELIPKIDIEKRYRKSTKLAQNGLKLKTTCAKCNNGLLGAEYDPALKYLYEETGVYIRNAKFLSGAFFKVSGVELNKAARAVVGHMLAADIKPNARASKSREMRRFLFENNYLLQDECSILMWIYPSREQAIIRDIFIMESFGRSASETIWASAYKTFPLAFAFTRREVKKDWPYKGVIDITRYLTSRVDDKFEITFSLKDIPHQIWPEAPSKDGAIMMGEGQRLLTKPHPKNQVYQH